MIGIEFAVAGVCVYVAARLQEKRKDTPVQITKPNGWLALLSKKGPQTNTIKAKATEIAKSNGVLVEMKLADKHKQTFVKRRRRQEKKMDRSDDSDSGSSVENEEQEVFGSGMWGADFSKLKYEDEDIECVTVYEEKINPRALLPIIHPYVLCETKSWVYVVEKWRDGLAVSRFKRKEVAIKSRGKWFGIGKLSVRRMPRLVQAKLTPRITTTEMLVWCIENPSFKEYTDNCHTFAANFSKKLGMQNPNTLIEELLYERY